MKIKNKKKQPFKDLSLYFKKFLENKSLIILIIILFPGAIFLSPILYKYAYQNTNKLPISKELKARIKDTLPFQLVQSDFKANVPLNTIKGILQRSDPLIIDIKFKDYKKLQNKRNKALKTGILFKDGDDYVSANMKYKNNYYKVKLRLKGDWVDHLAGKKWSFRVKVSDQKTLLGMRKFSLQSPKTRNYINEWIFHQLMKYENVPSLRYKFVPLILNGENYGIYAIEEHFDKILVESNNFKEGPIIRMSEDIYWEEIQRGTSPNEVSATFFKSNPEPFKEKQILNNPILQKQLIKANNLLIGFQKEDLKTSDAFDIDSLAKYFAIVDITNGQHSSVWTNLVFYYNPVLSKLMPIGFDAVPRRDEISQISIEEIRKYKFFEDNEFVARYVEYLEKFSSEDYLKNFELHITDEYKDNMNLLYKSFPALISNFESMYINQNTINKKINPIKPINGYLENFNKNTKELLISIGNNQNLPIQINGIAYKNKLIFIPNKKTIIKGTRRDNFVNYSYHSFILNQNIDPSNLLNNYDNEIQISFNILGSNTKRQAKINKYPRGNIDDLINDYVRKQSNFKSFKFIEYDSSKNLIFVKQGEWNLSETLILPQKHKLIIRSGTTLNLQKGASIISFGSIDLRGSNESPINIFGTQSGNAFIVLNSREESYLQNVHFKNLSSPKDESWSISGAVTFYESPVNFNLCIFEKNNSEDGLNLIRSDFKLTNSTFLDSKSDALDIDFSDGIISSLSMVNSGNDALDISGANVLVTELYIDKAEDKGISIGEASILNGKNILISGAEIAIASKDLSIFEASNIKVKSSKLAYVAFQKKPEFGPGNINITKQEISDTYKDYLLEKGSSIIIDGSSKAVNTLNVEKVLYGNIYGKKSGI